MNFTTLFSGWRNAEPKPRYAGADSKDTRAEYAKYVDLVRDNDPTRNGSTAKVALFTRCFCTGCPAFPSGDGHLMVETEMRLVDHEYSAVAISYTWGEFDRSRQALGHSKLSPTMIVEIELGQEWRLESFMERLAQLTEQYGACWIDQLCMPRRSDPVRAILDQIPVIFKSWHVVILMPGSLCACLKQALASISNEVPGLQPIGDGKAHSPLSSDPVAAALTGSSHLPPDCAPSVSNLFAALYGATCLNSNGACSWPLRIWTFQEYNYCRSFTMMYADIDPAPCCRYSESSVLPFDSLNKYYQLMYRRSQAELQLNDHEVMDRLAQYGKVFGTLLAARKWQKKRFQITQDRPSGIERLTGIARMILGEKQESDQFSGVEILTGRPYGFSARQESESDDQKISNHRQWLRGRALDDFARITYFEEMSFDRMVATQPVDYIMSVWPVFQCYKTPTNFDQLSAISLSGEAVRQWTSQYHVGFPTTCPTGLFVKHDDSFALFKQGCLGANKLDNSAQLYGLFDWSSPVPRGHDYYIQPLRVNTVRVFSCSEGGWTSLATFLEGSDSSSIFKLLCFWLSSTRRGYSSPYPVPGAVEVRRLLMSSSMDDITLGLKYLISQAVTSLRRFGFQFYEWSFETWKAQFPLEQLLCSVTMPVLEKTMYEMICEMLYLDADVCRRHKVQAVLSYWHADTQTTVSEDRPAPGERPDNNEKWKGLCIGLMRWNSLHEAQLHRQELVTIALETRHDNEGNKPLYEAVKLKRKRKRKLRRPGVGALDQYSIIGVWLPINTWGFKVREVGAVLIRAQRVWFNFDEVSGTDPSDKFNAYLV